MSAVRSRPGEPFFRARALAIYELTEDPDGVFSFVACFQVFAQEAYTSLKMAQNIDQHAVRIADMEPADSPRLVGQWILDRIASRDCVGMNPPPSMSATSIDTVISCDSQCLIGSREPG